ncbi:MAG TPA: hypothetical protein VHF26_03175, partial [Trebonia sp.]|nr:hypothetical protein [Trebonia sp.]
MTAGTKYTGRHASPRRKTTRNRVGRVVPAAAVAATLAAGTAAYAMTTSGGGQPRAGQLSDALTSPAGSAGTGAGRVNAAAAEITSAAPAATASVRHTARPT